MRRIRRYTAVILRMSALSLVLLCTVGVGCASATGVREVAADDATGRHGVSPPASRPSFEGVPTAALLGRLGDGDVWWDGTLVGLMPRLSPAAEEVLRRRDLAPADLVPLVRDPDRLVLAHVLLTRLSGGKHVFDAAHWNGLRVDLLGDGRVTYEPANLAQIRRHWLERLNAEGH